MNPPTVLPNLPGDGFKLRGPAQQPPRPDDNTYWLIPGKFLAGEYPGAKTEAPARAKLNRYLNAGVNVFIDLTEPHELTHYDGFLQDEARRRGLPVEYHRLSIEDTSLPGSPQHMETILNIIDAALAAGQTVYVHCWGGIGRTGTVVGCYLVRHGNTGSEALQEITRLWQNMAKKERKPHSPETAEQADYIRHWPEAAHG